MITKDDILDIWRVEPALAYYGFTTDAVKLRSGRREMLASLGEIQLCHDWIMLQDIGEKLTAKSPNSYMLKHHVEHAARQAGVYPAYVGNGCFIAAAIIAGVPYRRVGTQSPNALVAIKPMPVRHRRYPVEPYMSGKQYYPLPIPAWSE